MSAPSLRSIKVALVAHDNKKSQLIEWCREHWDQLRSCTLFATGTTGSLIEEKLGATIHKFKSGPLGGDQQIGAKIAEGDIDFVVFFMDPLAPHPHDVDVKALLRIAVVYDVPMACNRKSATLMISSLIQVAQK